MAELDRVSSILGGLEADMAHVRKTTDGIQATVKEANERIIIQEQRTKSAHKRLDKLQPIVDQHEKLKNKGAGIVLITGIIGAFLAYIGQAFLKIVF